ncbi:Proteasome subunit alpha type-6 [Xanthoria parietina]
MFRNNYDNDAITFSPQGRIFQIEYASEAVKQGSVTVGLCSKTHVVLVALKRNAEDLSSYQKKIINVDNHLGVSLAGLASDARVLTNFMKRQALASKMTYGRPIPVERIVEQIGDRAQTNTQNYSNRPYGVGSARGRRRRHGAPSIRVPAQRHDAGDGGVCDWGAEPDGADVFGAEPGCVCGLWARGAGDAWVEGVEGEFESG